MEVSQSENPIDFSSEGSGKNQTETILILGHKA